jgi:hypothetical protein
MNKTEFLDALQTTRAEWEQLLSQIDRARMTRPGVAGEWSVKDVIAHNTWHEREMIGVLQARALVGSDWWNLPTDERNHLIFEQNRHRSLDDVLAEVQPVYARLLDLARGLSDEELNDPARFRDMPAEWVPWQILADNTFDHYRQHMPALRAWLAGEGAS